MPDRVKDSPVDELESKAVRPIRLLFRLDDYSSRSSTEFEISLIELAHRCKIPITFGVVPAVCDGDELDPDFQEAQWLTLEKALILRDAVRAGTIEVAQHGCKHQTIRSTATQKPTEFIGRSFEDQHACLAEGKQYLEQILDLPVSLFIPPWNSYDANTLHALEALGFNCVSTGINFGEASTSNHIKFAPATCNLSELNEAVQTALRERDWGLLIIILMHEYDFLEVDVKRGFITLAQFEERVNWLRSQTDISILSFDDIMKSDHFEVDRYIANRRIKKDNRIIPPFLRSKAATGAYLTTDRARQLRYKFVGTVFLYYALLLFSISIFAYSLGSFVIGQFGRMPLLILVISLVVLCLSLLYIISSRRKYYRGLSALFLVIGVLVGSVISLI